MKLKRVVTLHRKAVSECAGQVVDAAISESVFNMLEGCVPEFAVHGYDRPPSGSTISGAGPPDGNLALPQLFPQGRNFNMSQ